jgi:hypothetical protein
VQPVERLTEDRLRRYLCHVAQTTGTVGQHMFFAKLRDAVRAMFPGKTPQILSQLVRRLEHKCQPRSLATRVVTTHRLIGLSKSLMKKAAGLEGGIIDIITYRDGLMIGLLACRPLRRRTFSLIGIRRDARKRLLNADGWPVQPSCSRLCQSPRHSRD